MANSANATNNDGGHGHGEHSHGIGRYIAVWLALLAGTALTVITGRIDLGAGNIVLAITIASIKATLVVLFFMHMIDTPAANRIVFVVSLVFSLVLIIGVFGDLWTRNEMSLPSGAPSTLAPEIQVPGTPAAERPAEH
ncbi:MAG TPA: cytochrome C oxidase subunit IV family protein [Polyangia bacterium]|nr:cytochrome C oxidase subunit IV family protein [Polyangia bacterium]